jgi:hypothetical protein
MNIEQLPIYKDPFLQLISSEYKGNQTILRVELSNLTVLFQFAWGQVSEVTLLSPDGCTRFGHFPTMEGACSQLAQYIEEKLELAWVDVDFIDEPVCYVTDRSKPRYFKKERGLDDVIEELEGDMDEGEIDAYIIPSCSSYEVIFENNLTT